MVTVTSPTFCDPPLFMARVFLTPLDSSHVAVSKIATTSGENCVASGTASCMWSKCPCEMQIVSTRGILCPFGYAGLPSIQGSMTMTCPEGSRN